MTLDDLGHKYGTDKASGSHDYLRWYEPILAPFKNERFHLLEMGIGSGPSLKMWRDFFPGAVIVGFDIESKTEHEMAHIYTVRGDQAKTEDLDRAIAVAGRLLVVNDDAGHQPESQLLAFKHLLPKMLPGGVYLLEDVGGQQVTEFFNRLALHCVHATWGNDGDSWVREVGPRIDWVSFYREVCAVGLKA